MGKLVNCLIMFNHFATLTGGFMVDNTYIRIYIYIIMYYILYYIILYYIIIYYIILYYFILYILYIYNILYI